jgi:Zn-dependent membrane protease YugP
VAGFGSQFSFILLFIGLMLSVRSPLGHLLVLAGLALFGVDVLFQLVNLPVEFNASSRAKVQLVELGIVSPQEMVYVNRVLNAAALTYVAATLQALLTLLYYLLRFTGDRRSGW